MTIQELLTQIRVLLDDYLADVKKDADDYIKEEKKLTPDEELNTGGVVFYHKLSSEMRAKVKSYFIEYYLKDNRFRKHYGASRKVCFDVLNGQCGIPFSLITSWRKEYLSTLTNEEKLQHNYPIEWAECSEEFKNKLYSIFLARIARTSLKRNLLISRFLGKCKSIYTNIPLEVLNEWYDKGVKKLSEMSEWQKWQNRYYFDYTKLTQEEKDNFYKELLSITNLSKANIDNIYLDYCKVPWQLIRKNRGESWKINN